MIIESFEIENWSCIKKLNVSGLSSTGVIVLHGPNRTGKSSIVHALRACLMDYPSTTTAVKSSYPRGTGEKPVVSVTFQANGATYRIKKCFGTNKSELASKTLTGAWKVETTTAGEAHARTCDYAGSTDSTKGMHQLLWLTQAEFRLPDAKRFDASIQSQLRGILGVLQTPLDDRFIERVKKCWGVWFSGQRKPAKQNEIKDNCKLAENLKRLEAGRKELQESEGKFNEVEGLLRQSAELELGKLDLERQLRDRTSELQELRDEHRRSQMRIGARQQAEKDHAGAQKELTTALEEQQQRADTAQRAVETDEAVEPAQTRAAEIGRRVNALVEKRDELRTELGMQRNKRRDIQHRANCVAAQLRALELEDKLAAAQRAFERARAISEEIAQIERYLASHRAPDDGTLDALKVNRQRWLRLRAERQAASMDLSLIPHEDASNAQLAIDGDPLQNLPVSDAPIHRAVRRRAELIIDGWGRVELSRGTGSGDLDQIERELSSLDESFADAVAPLGISPSDPQALDKLMDRASEHRLRKPALAKHEKEVKQLAPKGLEPLQLNVVELRTKLEDIKATEAAGLEQVAVEQCGLEKLTANLKLQLSSKDESIKALEDDDNKTERELVLERQAETSAKEALAGCKAKANSTREELDRLRSKEGITQRVEDASRARVEAELQLKLTELTNDECTIDERLVAAEEAEIALERQIEENTKKYHEIKGRLSASEGLHSHRSSVAARVDELTRLTEHESLEKDAVDRLYALFEACREKQLGTLMSPIHDRVLGWMRFVAIGDYREMRFNDAFLPDRLMSRDGTADFAIAEESTGAQEQIGMFVRLALGSILASACDPAVAILDDPLTHCDIGRLNKMRVILRRAAQGDQNVIPPGGPLQIIILTCHPEWFRDEKATVIDLENPDVMSRWPS